MEVIKKSPVTWGIIIVNTVVFLLVELTGGSNDAGHMLDWGAAFAPYIVGQGQYYRLFTCMFLHFGMAHLGNNMLLLYCVGSVLEREAGKLKYLIIYMTGGLGASCLSCYLEIRNQSVSISAGASGAIFAVIGGVLWVLIRNKGRLEDLTVKQMAFMAALSLYFGFVSTGVDNAAHVGGLIMGFLVTMLIYRRRQRWRYAESEAATTQEE